METLIYPRVPTCTNQKFQATSTARLPPQPSPAASDNFLGVLQRQGLSTAVGDEGGFAPDLPSNQAALDTIMQAIEEAGYSAGREILLGLDVASSEFYADGSYRLESEGRAFDAARFCDYLASLVDGYPIISIEDGMDEGDWDGWGLLTERLG